MDTLDTHIYKLRFRLDYGTPKKYINKWEQIKNSCESTNNEYLVEEIKDNCRLESNKNLPYLMRCEGGLGGDDNILHKQIRFRYNHTNVYRHDNDILLYVYNSDEEKWSYQELNDISRSLLKILNKKMSIECVKGCIEMFNNNIYDEYNLDSDK